MHQPRFVKFKEVIMSRIKLDDRLLSVASLVRNGSVVADVGTDHAYIVAYLIQKGIIEKAIASDINKGPLENARQTLIDCDISENVTLILSDGLKNVPENSADDIVIAGMGGILISEILENAPWIKNENVHIIAQPMTHGETLRKWLCENGFIINKEVASTDGKRLYVAISASYTGEKSNRNEAYYYVGELSKNSDELSERYIEKTLLSLEKKYNAQKSAGLEDKEGLGELILEIKTLI